MTEEMQEEETVKRYNKEFMRKHTRMRNRNKPKQTKRQKANIDYNEELIREFNDQALIDSLESLLEKE